MWNSHSGFRHVQSAPLGISMIKASQSFHVNHKVPTGDSPYARAKKVQMIEKDPKRAIPMFWAAINLGDRVDSALKDMVTVMKQQNRADEAIEAIKSFRNRCSYQAQNGLDNILLELYKKCGRLDDQIGLLKHKLFMIQQSVVFNNRKQRTKTARLHEKKFQNSVQKETTRLLCKLGWALMQQNKYIEAEDAYREAMLISPDNIKILNLGICLMKQGKINEAKMTIRRVKLPTADRPRGINTHLKAYEIAQQMLRDLESNKMNTNLDVFLYSSSPWQPHPCKEITFNSSRNRDESFCSKENINYNEISTYQNVVVQQQPMMTINSLNNDTRHFHYLSSGITNNPFGCQIREIHLKRTSSNVREEELENKTKKKSISAQEKKCLENHLPTDKEFEDAMIGAMLGCNLRRL